MQQPLQVGGQLGRAPDIIVLRIHQHHVFLHLHLRSGFRCSSSAYPDVLPAGADVPAVAGIVQRPAAMNETILHRREALRRMALFAAGAALPVPLAACADDPPAGEPPPDPALEEPRETEVAAEPPGPEDAERLLSWVGTLRQEGLADLAVPLGLAAVRVGELAAGTPYEAFTLEEYIRAGNSPMRTEPLTLHLTKFDCVTLVEACLAIARIARSGREPTWTAYAGEMERMRYRGGERTGYTSRLHYFSDWLGDNERRGLVDRLGEELGGLPDERPLRFMSSNPDAYPALAHEEVLAEIRAMERSLDRQPRHVVPTAQIPVIVDRLESGDILAFATAIEGLDVTHAAFAYDDDGVMRILHAPLSGGVVEITDDTVQEYVQAIRQSTGILVARPLDG